MEKHTLILNASYEVMRVVKWQRAVIWYFAGKVDVLEEYPDIIRSPSMEMKIPAVVRYKKMVRIKTCPLRFSRQNIYIRDNYSCLYCGAELSYAQLTMDHILPRSRGGRNSWDNCVSCCRNCNVFKGDRTPNEAGMILLNEPRQPTINEALLLTMKTKLLSMPDLWKNYCQVIC